MKLVDLHVHSTVSDGTDTPEELVEAASRIPLSAFALTDHDTLEGIKRAKAAAKVLQQTTDQGKIVPRVIPGVEISVGYGGRDIHVLGLFIDEDNEALNRLLSDFRKRRTLRNEQMITRFCEAGIPMTLEELNHHNPNTIVTRAHFARFLMDHGYAKDRDDAFLRFVGDNAPFYIPRTYISPAEAILCIKNAGGLSVLAHPLSYRFTDEQLLTMTSLLRNVGLDAVEALYGAYDSTQEAKVRELAKRYDLLLSGGSDYHGSNKPGLMLGTGFGELRVTEDVLNNLEKRITGADRP